MPKQAKTNEQSVAQYVGNVIAVGQQSDNADFALTIRTSDGEYIKVWHHTPLARGNEVTVDQVSWPNGWKDYFILDS